MRIRDLTDTSRPQTRAAADKLLQAAGYQRIGKGDFGAVYEKPGRNYVLKVFTVVDRGYRNFISLALAHQDNPHFPRFSGKLIRVTPNYYAIRMEKLTPFDPQAVGDYAYAIFDYIQDGQPEPDLEPYPELRAACDLVRKTLLSQYHFDHKDGSFMMRGQTIVITDPVLDLAAKDDVRGDPRHQLEPAADTPTKWTPELEALMRDLGEG